MNTQCMDALALANQRRVAYMKFKRDLASLPGKQGRRFLADALEDENETLMGIDIQSVLRSLSGFGTVKARTVLKMAGVLGVSRKVRDLSPRQRETIAQTLRGMR